MRKLATVQRISEIKAITGADAIEAFRVGGWWVVDKKDAYAVGDLAIYIEIDSWIPNVLAPFLNKGKLEPRTYKGVAGERLRTIKLRGQVSQGLLLPIDGIGIKVEGDDVTEALGIQKWEAPIPACLAGMARGGFPSAIPKTDQERIQNLAPVLDSWANFKWEVTEKLDGTSATYFLDEAGDFHVCSRNLDLKDSEGNTHWMIAKKYNIHEKMLAKGLLGFAIQGEIIGEGIQGNKYKLTGQDFFVFDMYDSQARVYGSAEDRQRITKELNLNHTPVIIHSSLVGLNVDAILDYAEGKSILNAKTEREGIVFKCIEDPSISFKSISNRFLLKGGDL